MLDHSGLLNALVGCAPLLKRFSTSTLRTKIPVRFPDVNLSVEYQMGGDIPTVALLLGLQPAGYWANAAATHHFEEMRLDAQWRPVDASAMHFDVLNLVFILSDVYMRMFIYES
jgi:hypothetical protein